ncbi:dehydrodolichyl diphosphate synthase complex subunit Nus1-like [Cylas formicarius]|uniref:dehydrodolichyl diphosphate synthase complex subunit Nus1-like n=1 Tax=Cylas formicarius TaxID=197179 RepID=UPI0029584AA8|nr:dehydrodolichyl diphosphate synthase complex subunit Nus1-like [Cylas formicarius]
MTGSAMFNAIYVLVHCLYDILEYIYCNLKEIGDAINNKFSHEIRIAPDQLRKIPKHLTVILGKEEPSYKDLANIILWCLVHRIAFVSFYDWKGVLNKNEDKFSSEVEKIKPEGSHIIWHTNSSSSLKNGFTGNKIHVKILTEEDGKLGLVNFTKNLVTKNREDLSTESLICSIHKYFAFPEPEVALYCDQTILLRNYPPWQTRITEFFSVKTHHNISYKTFFETLSLYNKTEQRCGK